MARTVWRTDAKYFECILSLRGRDPPRRGPYECMMGSSKDQLEKVNPPFYVLCALRSLAAYSSTPHREHSLLTLALLLIERASAVQIKRQERGRSELARCIWRCRKRRFCSVKVKLFHDEHNIGIISKIFFFPGSKVMILNIIAVSQIHTAATQSFSTSLTPLEKA